MIKNISLACVAIMLANISFAQMETADDSLSYAYGAQLAKRIESKNMKNISLDLIQKGFNDYQIKKSELGDVNLEAFIQDKETWALREVGEKFLAQQRQNPVVKEMSDGILYKVLKEGTGEMTPKSDADVTIHYEGRLIDGTVFDSSYKRGEPATFNLKRLIKAWQIVVPDMKKGEKRTIYVPYTMAYGSRGAGQLIKPYSTLIFDIELIEF